MFLKTNRPILHPTSPIQDDKPQHLLKLTTAMAADFAMPVQQFTPSPSQYTLYNSQQTSPINSATGTPSDTSPTSPRTGPPPHLPAHTRQLRPPKSPLYVPAVLRPTDPPRRVTRSSPLTPPQSMHNSFDDLANARTISRRSTADSGKFGLGQITEAEWSSEGFGKVTALPTREHWKVCQQTPFLSGFSRLCGEKNQYSDRKLALQPFLFWFQKRCCNTLMAIAC